MNVKPQSGNLRNGSASIQHLETLQELVDLRDAIKAKVEHNRIGTYYPDSGPLRRELYPQHVKFFEAGTTYRERLFLAANRVGKTEGVGAYETTLHLTGRYPNWWKGKRFMEPIDAWAAGDTSKTVHLEIIQPKLLGRSGDPGTGMIPADAIIRQLPKMGVPDGVEKIEVRHVSGGISRLTLKTYEQGRKSFQGTEKHLVWLDEECPQDIYTECLMRTMKTAHFPGGIIMLTFTPLSGLTPLVLEFMPHLKTTESM